MKTENIIAYRGIPFVGRQPVGELRWKAPVDYRSTEQAVECTNEMMDILGCKTVADLQKVDARRFVKEAETIVLRVAPERDGKYLPADPHKAYADGAAKDIAFLLGCNKDEMAWFVSVMGEEGFKEWAADRKANRLVKLTDDERKRVESFCNDVKGEDLEPDSRLIEQIWFNTPTVRMSENLTKCGGKSHTYFFTVNPSLPFVHGEELTIVFNHPEMEE